MRRLTRETGDAEAVQHKKVPNLHRKFGNYAEKTGPING